MKREKLVEMDLQVQDLILDILYIHHPNESIEVCDPYYTEPVLEPYTDDIDWDAKWEEYDSYYDEERKQDELRYSFYLEMLEVKKRMAEDPIIFDKEEEYYEKDPHKLVDFDEYFTPFFEKESNDAFFKNLENPLRLKWEEIPEEDRKIKIVPIDQSIRKLKYDEVEKYFTKYLINKDIVLLFLKFMPNIWPISSFIRPFENYVKNMTGQQMYEFFIKRVVLLSSSYTPKAEVYAITEQEKNVAAYMREAYKIKERMFHDLLRCIKVRPIKLLFKARETDEEILMKSENLKFPDIAIETDILTRFIQKYQLYVPHKNTKVVKVYNYPEISKLIILLNLSFFNIFPISTNGYEDIRQSNKVLFIHFLWYLKDFFWEGHESTLQLKNDIKSYFQNEEEYLSYSKLLQYYPSRMVAAKEYFFSYHNQILREIAVDYLEDYFEKEDAKEKIEYRHNADFYLLNQELQAFEKLKMKIYAKSRKLNKTDDEIKILIENAYQRHKKHQLYLSKIYFKEARRRELADTVKNEKIVEEILEKRDSLDFYIEEDKIITRTYTEIIKETKILFIDTLKALDIYDEIKSTYNNEYEPKKYNDPKMSIFTKLLDKKLIEPNLWNKFEDYCLLALERYPTKITELTQLYKYLGHFIEDFLRDVLCIFGEGSYVPSHLNPLLKGKRRKKNIK